MKWFRILFFLLLMVLASACSDDEPTPAALDEIRWIEEEVIFTSGANELFGVLTKPEGAGPFPAIIMISGSGNSVTGLRAGTSSRYFADHAHTLAGVGFAVLRYDPPGVGKSSRQTGFESLDIRAEEAIAAVKYLQSRSDIVRDAVGLHGNSQGAWVNALTAAEYPRDVAFIINVSGSGVSVAEQQVYSIESQSKNAGFSEEDVTKATMFGRMLVDWQLDEPIYKGINESDAEKLGSGPWEEFLALVYEPGGISPAEAFQQGIEILKSIRFKPWARYVYPDLYISQMEKVPPEQAEILKAMTGLTLIQNPEDYFTNVTSPVLAIFGEEDLLQPTEKSAALYEEYLTEAGNDAFEIVILPGVGHNIQVDTPGYRTLILEWLEALEL